MHRPTLQPAFRQIAGRFLRAAWPACLLAAFLALAALPAHGQNSPAQSHPMLPQPLGQSVNDDGAAAADHEQAERLLRALNADRQKALVNDTNKLLRLVNAYEIDFAIASLPIHDDRLVKETLLSEELLLAVPPGHLLAKRRGIATADLEPERFREVHEFKQSVLDSGQPGRRAQLRRRPSRGPRSCGAAPLDRLRSPRAKEC